MRKLEDCKRIFEEKLSESPLLVCYIDGLGYELYKWASGKTRLKMNGRFHIEPIISVEPPLTNAAMATMLTGVSPKVHGIHSHRDRKLAIDTIFHGYEEGSLFLEGDSNILLCEKRPVLHVKRDGVDVDEWIYRDICKGIERKIPFIFAHFHQIDDIAHQMGPYHEETLCQIVKMDQWIYNLTEKFQGEIILVSDHGLTEKDGQGVHGENNHLHEENDEEMLAIWGTLYESK